MASVLFPLPWGCLQNVINPGKVRISPGPSNIYKPELKTDFVEPEYHLCRLAGLHQDLPLHAEALGDPQLLHAPHLPLCHVQTLGGEGCQFKKKRSKLPQKTYHGAFAENMLGLELADQLSRVVPSVLGNDGGQLSGKQ